jgi:tripartite-type tricarboxylate transporter receptor subunit TctC
LDEAGLRRQLAAQTIEVMSASRQAFGQYLASEAKKWRAVIRQAGVSND